MGAHSARARINGTVRGIPAAAIRALAGNRLARTTVGVNATAWERVIVALASLGGVTFLGATGHLDGQAVIGIYAAVVGYVLGHSAGQTAEKIRQENGDKRNG